jgi:hypothetical protein
MNELKKRIEDTEAKVVESELLGALAMDSEVRTYNERLAVELREFAQKMRAGLLVTA